MQVSVTPVHLGAAKKRVKFSEEPPQVRQMSPLPPDPEEKYADDEQEGQVEEETKLESVEVRREQVNKERTGMDDEEEQDHKKEEKSSERENAVESLETETEVSPDYDAVLLEEKESGKKYLALDDGQRLILCKRTANKHNPAYHPVWWSQNTSKTKAQIKRPSDSHKLWLITDKEDWRTVKTYGKVLDQAYKMDAETDTEIYQQIKGGRNSSL